MVDFFSNLSKKRLECQSIEAQNLSEVMLSTRSSLVIRGENSTTQSQSRHGLPRTIMEKCVCVCDATQVEKTVNQVQRKKIK